MGYTVWADPDPARAALAYKRFSPEQRPYVIWCSTAESAINALDQFDVEELFLTHRFEELDVLSPTCRDCGHDVVNWLVDHAAKFIRLPVTVTTHEYESGKRMTRNLRRIGISAKYVPFGQSREISV